MSYQHIENLYKCQDILAFKRCYAMEKIHGTSAHVSWKNGAVNFFAGGTDHKSFVALFDADALAVAFAGLGQEEVVVFGEAYGGKMQGMRDTYGDKLRFIAFEVKIGDSWLCVPDAEKVAISLGLEFVHYDEVSTELEVLDMVRDADSVQAIRNGMGTGHQREGVVLRPLFEVKKNNGERVIAKHKGEKFRETSTPRVVDADRLQVLSNAEAIAREWVTPMRLQHVCDGMEIAIENIGPIIKAMQADIEREANGEVEMTADARKFIGRDTALLVKRQVSRALHGEVA